LFAISVFLLEPSAKNIFSFGRKHTIGSDKIFEDPQFKSHARTVVAMVDTAIGLLEAGQTDALFAALRELGSRHASYSVEQYHYPIVGEALLLTLGAALGDGFTDDVRREWTAVVDQIFNTMVTTW
jgi:hemoglobin-like flavoprotein